MIRRLSHAVGMSLLVSVLTSPVWAAALPLEAARTELARSHDAVRRLREAQGTLRAELQALSAEIEAFKARRREGTWGGDPLEERLRHSQELSGRLNALSRELAAAETKSAEKRASLLEALSASSAALKGEWERAPTREARHALVERMRALRSERDALRGTLNGTEAVLPSAAASAESSDDPEDLLEQADALRDAEDKVRQRLKQVSIRIAEAREERDLDQRMGQFLGEEAMFDDRDRRFRARPSSRNDFAAGPDGFAGSAEEVSATPSAPGVPAAPPSPPSAPGEAPSTGVLAPSGIGNAPAAGEGLPPGGTHLKALERLRGELEAAAEQLRARARETEARARQLR